MRRLYVCDLGLRNFDCRTMPSSWALLILLRAVLSKRTFIYRSVRWTFGNQITSRSRQLTDFVSVQSSCFAISVFNT